MFGGKTWDLFFVVCLIFSTARISSAIKKDTVPVAAESCDKLVSFQCAKDPEEDKKQDGKHICIHKTWVCDGDKDCPLGDDEEQNCDRRPACSRGQFECPPPSKIRCIAQRWTCDGEKDCDGGEDEFPSLCHARAKKGPRFRGSMVDTFKCPPNQYRCPGTRTCIHLANVCDGAVDCIRDGADEGPHCINRACHSKDCPHNMCKETSQGARCYCQEGRGWNGTHCEDINECQYDHYCDQKCENNDGGYVCSCMEGFALKEKHLCQIEDSPRPFLAVSSYKVSLLVDLRSLTGKLAEDVYKVSGRHVAALDVDVRNNSICWITFGLTEQKAKLMCSHADNAETTWEIKTQYSLSSVRAMAKDWVSGNWYFADGTREMIFACTADGAQCRTIVTKGVRRPRSLAVDPTKGYLFFADWSSSQIGRVDLDGSNLQVLAKIKIVHPNGLTLDLAKSQIYWGDSFLNVIERCDYDGRNRIIISKGADVSHVSGMTLLENYLYVANHYDNSIIRVHRYDHNVPNKVMFRAPSKPGAIKIMHPVAQPLGSSENVCEVAACDHMCFPLPERNNDSTTSLKAKCVCFHGYEMNADGSCQARTREDFIILTNGQQGMIHLMSPDLDEINIDMYPPIPDLGRPVAVAIDSATGYVYFSDLSVPMVGRRLYNSSEEPEQFFTSGLTCDGLDVDWVGRNLYCADSGHNRIVAISLNDANLLATVFSSEKVGGTIYPKALALDVESRELHWSNWVISEEIGNASISVANMDGSGYRVITQTDILWPNGLTLDKENSVLYWTDAHYDWVASINVDGTDRKTIHKFTTNQHPYGLALINRVLVWAESMEGQVMTFNLTSQLLKTYDLFSPPVFGVKYFHPKSQSAIDNPCSVENGGCSDLCLLAPNKTHKCVCADGRTSTDNGTTCTGEVRKALCSRFSDFTCKNGDCIPHSKACDGVRDCTDGSDEEQAPGAVCERTTCSSLMFQCNSSLCIYKSFLCDGEVDCPDGDDEKDCHARVCPSDHFQCNKTGQCLPNTWKCDGEKDCRDGSDEDAADCCPNGDCKSITCGPDTYRCRNGQCIKYQFRCDNEYDCLDLSDELECDEWCDPVREFKCLNASRCLPKVYKCDGVRNCPDGSDERNCESITPQCHEDEFACTDGSCLNIKFKCDSQKDCLDGSDEMNCFKNTSSVLQCHWSQFMCEDKSACIPSTWQCDKDFDCSDHSDEKHCAEDCPLPKFSCHKHSSMCLELTKVCDGVNDCPDHSDEGRLCEYDMCVNHDCEYMCNRTPYGFQCSCPENMRLMSDERKCVDINICEQWGICSQECNLTKSGHRCHCKEGYTLEADGYSCKPNGKEPVYILYSNQHQIHRINMHNNSVLSLIQGLHHAISIDFHYKKNFLIWTDIVEDKMFRGEMVANTVARYYPIVQKGLTKVEGLAVDWITDTIYWVDSNVDQIEVARLDGNYRVTLIAENMTSPRALVLDPRVGKLFWSDWDGEYPRIETSSLAGEPHTRKVLYDIRRNKGGGWPNGITVDFDSQRIYWADARLDSIHSITYDGADHRLIAKSRQTLNHPFAITQFGHRVFWTDWDLNGLGMANKFNGSNLQVIQKTYSQPFDVKVFHPKRQPQIKNPCENTECSHLCLIGDGLKPVCRCPHRFKMSADQKTCKEDQTFLLMVKMTEIRGMDMENAHYNIFPPISTPFVGNASSIDYDMEGDKLFWTDLKKKVIVSAFLNGTGIATVIDSGLPNPSAIGIDWMSRNMYFASHDDKIATISVSRLDGAFRKDIFNWKNSVINSLVLQPNKGYMYWSDRGKEQAIWMAKMDGQDPKVFATRSPASNPGSLSLDEADNRLYWIDRHTEDLSQIMWCSLVSEIPCKPTVETELSIKSPFTMTVYNNMDAISTAEKRNFIIYSETNVLKIEGVQTKILQKDTPLVKDFKVYDPRLRKGENGCSKNNGGCPQLCLPSGESIVCACTLGFVSNGTGCAGRKSFLMYSTASEIRGLTINERHPALAPISKISAASSIGFHNDYIYWVDSEIHQISRIKRDLSGRETIISDGISGAESLAINWMSGHIYWTDLGHNIIEMSLLNGTSRFVVISENLERPRSLVINPNLGLLYFTDWGRNRRIVKAYLDGSGAETFVESKKDFPVKSPYGLAIDYSNNDLYWCDKELNIIERVDVTGKRSKVVTSNLTDCMSLAIHGDYLFWADRTDLRGSIKYVDKMTGEGRTVMLQNSPSLKDIFMYDASIHVGTNPCSWNNGGCEELCFYKGNQEVACACSHGKLKADRKSCEDYKGFLLYSEVTSLNSLHLHSTDHNNPIKPIQNNKRLINVIGLSFDYSTQRIFFSDVQKGNIQSVFFNGTGYTYILQAIGSAEGLAFEPMEKQLYWTSYSGSSINRISFSADGTPSSNIILQLSANDHPRHIVINPCIRRIYWTNWNMLRPSIQTATYITDPQPGQKAVIDVKSLFSMGIKVPNGLTIDHKGQRLYWSDARLDKIESCDMDGENRKIILEHMPRHPFGLAVHGSHIYWTDWRWKAVYRANKYDGGDIVTLKSNIDRQPMGLIAVAEDTDDCTLNPCYKNAYGCSHFCSIDIRDMPRCSCPPGLQLLNDTRRCVSVPSTCLHDSDFVCKDHSICVGLEKTCDRHAHCPDGSDESEVYCEKRICGEGFFSCHKSHQCIPAEKQCDNLNDCFDLSDEENCLCSENEFRCNSGGCISQKYICDDDPDCDDHSDEMGCEKSCNKEGMISCNTTTKCIYQAWLCDGTNDCWDNNDEKDCQSLVTNKCEADSFKCANGKCIKKEWVCDKENDCQDGSDEIDCKYTCLRNQHVCSDRKCVPSAWLCDGHPDCTDGSDEPEECKTRNCTADQFRCLSGRCISRDWLCDGESDCALGEDERMDMANCDPVQCEAKQFTCLNRRCIDMKFYCDGQDDCRDNSDEPDESCGQRTCEENEFQCGIFGFCIKASKRCDGVNDCIDKSDEAHCHGLVEGCNNATHWECKNSKTCIIRDKICNGIIDCPDGSDEPANCGINECAQRPLCSQLCVDKVVGYECQCYPGYQMLNVSLHHNANSPDKRCVDIDECQTKFPCSHYCTNTIGSFKCSCPAGYTFMPDKVSCRVSNGIVPQLLVSNRYYLLLINITHAKISTVTSKLKNSVAVDYDWMSQSIFWTDISSTASTISRMPYNFINHTTGPVQVLHQQMIRNPDGLAVDWVARNLYWCDKTTDTIEVSTLDGLYRKVLLRRGLQEPRALEVYPQKGLLFVTDWGDTPFIGRMNMDGTDFRVIINESLAWPNALTIDYVTGKIFWGDGNLDYIGMADLDGQNARIIMGEGKKVVPHIFALTTFENLLYWTDWEHIGVFTAKKFSGRNTTKLISLSEKPMDIHIVHPLRQEQVLDKFGNTPCDKLQCSHLCLLRPGKKPGSLAATCACPEYHYLDTDRRTCISNCTSSQFLCKTSSKCIPFWWQCDGSKDCPDGSDEPVGVCGKYYCSHHGMFQCADATSESDCLFPTQICDGKPQCSDQSDESICSGYTCMEHFFKCKKDNKCIPKSLVCDGTPHCSDKEDEIDCTARRCAKNDFHCDNGECVPYVWKCDDDNDCGDGSDEFGCHNTTCKANHVRCNSTGKCIPETWKCDGEKDCGDLSDELDTECHQLTCPPNSFRCLNGHCILEKWHCDHDEDCNDGTDELNCEFKNCTSEEFQCKNGKCIPSSQRCNGVFDCHDRSDEMCEVECDPKTKFKCLKYPECIHKEWECDGDTDCTDGTDEWDCDVTCLENEFRCNNKLCVSNQFVCDGYDDCKDNSDENQTMCANRTCPPSRFRCHDHVCIWLSMVCDTHPDCKNGEDEQKDMCSVVQECSLPNFLCESGTQCIHPNKVCDGNHDCFDASDEKKDFCEFLKINKTRYCTVNNGGCEQICNETSFGPQCGCKKPFHLNPDGLTCSYKDPCLELDSCSQICDSGGEMLDKPVCSCLPGYELIHAENRCSAKGPAAELLLPEPGKGLKLVPLADKTLQRKTDIKKHQEGVVSLDVDVNANTAFIINLKGTDYLLTKYSNFQKKAGENRVKRSSVAAQPEILHLQDKNLFAINSIAIDWVSKHMYLADATNRAIHVYNYDATRGKTVVQDKIGVPHTIAVDPLVGRIFWTDQGIKPKIESANLDGSERYILASVEMAQPSGIVADLGRRWIYWVDSRKLTVEAARYDGSGRKIIYGVMPFTDDPPHSLELFEDDLYVLTSTRNLIIKLDKFGRSPGKGTILNVAQHHIRDFVIVQKSKQVPVTSNCTDTSCHQTQICFNRPQQPTGFACACPDDAVFRDNKCDFELPLSCDGYCHNGGHCQLSPNKKKIRCDCPVTHKGERCEKPVCEDYCQNNGVCTPPTGTQQQPICSCKDGRHGPRCENFGCTNYCLNGAVCVDVFEGDAMPLCICSVDHTGKRCETVIQTSNWCPKICHNNATCTRETSGYIKCHCPDGFTGERCEKCVDLTCYNTGVCVKDQAGQSACQCSAGYDPWTFCRKKLSCQTICQTKSAVPDHCNCSCSPHFLAKHCMSCEDGYCKHGICQMHETGPACLCDDYHEGERCNTCKCGSTGACVQNDRNETQCHCSLETFGQFCQDSCIGSCGKGGLCHECFLNKTTRMGECREGKCVCNPGYTGMFCETELAGSTSNSQNSAEINPVVVAILAVALVIALVILVIAFTVYKKRRRSQYHHKRMNGGDNMNVSNPVYMKRDGEDDDDEELHPLESRQNMPTGDNETDLSSPMFEFFPNSHDSQQQLLSSAQGMGNNPDLDDESIQFIGTDDNRNEDTWTSIA